MNLYREVPKKFGALQTFKAELLSAIHLDQLQNSESHWFEYSDTNSLYLPVLELSCGKATYLQENQLLKQKDSSKTSDAQLEKEEMK
jgi:hypothetical protein